MTTKVSTTGCRNFIIKTADDMTALGAALAILSRLLKGSIVDNHAVDGHSAY